MSYILKSLLPWVELTRVRLLVGPLLFFWPLAWSLTIIAKDSGLQLSTYFWMLAIGYIWANLAHSAGCIWNDITDRELDRKVERTKNRPIADGRISIAGALVFLALHLFALCYMISTVNAFAWNLGLISIFLLPGIYPYMKRLTHWPQAWLGMTMNTGVPMAWAILVGHCPPGCLVLATGAWSWTIWYDTIYACQDMKDDRKAGIKSTALLFSSRMKIILLIFGSVLVGCLIVSGILNGQGLSYFAIGVGGAIVHLTYQLTGINPDDPEYCKNMFLENGFVFGGIVWVGLFVDYIHV